MTLPTAQDQLDMHADSMGSPFVQGSTVPAEDFDDMHADSMGSPYTANEDNPPAFFFFIP